jgi:hypothetical protein
MVKLNTPTAQRSVLRMLLSELKDKPELIPRLTFLFTLSGFDLTLTGACDGPSGDHPGLEEQKVLDWLEEVVK